MTNPRLGVERDTSQRPRRRRSRLGWIAGVLLAIAGILAVLAYWLGVSTAKGWRQLAGEISDSIGMYDQATPLPQGSRVTYRGSTVARLTMYRRFPRENSLGGPLLVFEGNWEPGATAERARADSTLIGTTAGDLDEKRPLVIELLDQPAPAQHPQGLLRLRPFYHGYRIY